MDVLKNTLLSGSIFNDYFNGSSFFKITNKDETVGLSYYLKDGLNEIELKQNLQYVHGGLKFFDINNLLFGMRFLCDYKFIRKVEIPDDAIVFISEKEYLSNKIILKDKILIEDLEMWNNIDFCIKAMEIDYKLLKFMKNHLNIVDMKTFLNNPNIIEYIKEPSNEMCLLAIKHSPFLIKYIKNPNLEMCIMAMKKSVYSLKYIDNIDPLILMELVKINPQAIEHIVCQTKEMCIEAIKKSPSVIKYINLLDNDLFELAFDLTPNALSNIPDDYKTLEMCIKAVQYDSNLLQYVPEKYINENIVTDAITKCGKSIRFVKNPSDNLCFKALENDLSSINYIKNPTDEMYLMVSKVFPYLLNKIKDKTKIKDEQDLCKLIELFPNNITDIIKPSEKLSLIAVKKSGNILKYIDNQTDEICMVSVQYYPDTLEFVKNQTDEICIVALSQKGKLLKFVNDKKKYICEIALENDGLALEFIDDQTVKLCKIALRKNIQSYKYIKNKNDDINLYTISLDADSLKDIINLSGIEKISEKVCIEALKKKGSLLKYIPKDYQTYEMCHLAIENDPESISFFDEKYFSCENLVKLALFKNSFVIKHIKNPSNEICNLALEQNPLSIRFIENQTNELCIKAINLDTNALSCIKQQTVEMCFICVNKNASSMLNINDQNEDLCKYCTLLNHNVIQYIRNFEIRKKCIELVDEIRISSLSESMK